MKWLILLREVSMTLGTITAIIAHAMGALTINLSVGGVFNGPIQYAHLGVGAGVVTILSLPMILLYDMAQEASYSATVIFELIWMLGLSVLWIVVGVKTMGITTTQFKNCSILDAKVAGLCTDAQTMVLFAFLSAGFFMLYTAALGLVATARASSGNPIWTQFSMTTTNKKR